jgi:hypothetical protein
LARAVHPQAVLYPSLSDGLGKVGKVRPDRIVLREFTGKWESPPLGQTHRYQPIF